MRRTRFLGLAVSTVCLLAIGCGSSGAGGTGGASGSTGGASGSTGGTSGGTGGTSGGTGGTSGGTGGTSGGTGGASAGFMSVAPCTTEVMYTTTGTTVVFGAATAGYMPKCLKVSAGASVTFMGGGGTMDDFATHPLTPSAMRGTTVGNPITATSSGTSKNVSFAVAGTYAYYCAVHGNDTTGTGWSGVVWVQ